MMNLWKHLIFVLLCVFSAVSQAAWSVRYQHTDVLGSVIAESNAQGTITQRFGYKPFGEGSPTQKTGVGYTGHLEDTDLGLTYMQQRYYDPVIGRFYSNDPVGFSAASPMMFNRYAYANNNPYKFTDPNGENPAVTWAATRSFRAGYSVGSKINSGITAGLGKPLGVAIYDVLHSETPGNQPSGDTTITGGVEITNEGSIKNAEVGDTVRTPENSGDFVKLKGSQGWRDSKTGDIVKKSDSNHSKDPKGEYKFGVKPKQPPTPDKKITVTISDSKVYKIDK